jgi:mediator of RNA polymerase II transcription subunit 5
VRLTKPYSLNSALTGPLDRNATIRFHILRDLITSGSCPQVVLDLCGPQISALLRMIEDHDLMSSFNIDAPRLSTLMDTLGPNAGRSFFFRRLKLVADKEHQAYAQRVLSARSQNLLMWRDQAHNAIQVALTVARTGKAPSIDVENCIKTTAPTTFLRTLWAELSTAASVGDMEACHRLAVFVLTMPRRLSAKKQTPPLLPIFLHVVVPSLVPVIDKQQAPEQPRSLDLLVTIVSSVLTASLHLELVGFSLGYTTASIARRLAMDLRSRPRSPTSVALTQRLSSSQSFVANFPVFTTE